MERVLAVILAGGRGDRLSVLAQERTKPAIPFAGKYRIIDFTLSNCVNSGIYDVVILTQYQPLSLVDHIGVGTAWGLAISGRGVRLLQPYLAREEGRDWYKGTADAVYQNLQNIDGHDAEFVLILSGDHVYKMDYSLMLKFHEEKQADVTLAFTRLPREDLHEFGTVTVDETGRVTGFEEKKKKPSSNLVSMGVYLFKKDALRQWLEGDAGSMTSRHDFGKDIFPKLVDKGRTFAYNFEGYWRDVGTVQTYWQANMRMIEMSPVFTSDAGWLIHTKEEERSPAMFSETANVVNSIISNGCIIEGQVENSVLSPGVMVVEGAVVKDSIILSDSIVGQQSVVNYSVLDKEVVVEAGCHIGFSDDFQVNRKEPKVVNSGITIVGKRAKIPPGVKIGRNCVINCGAVEEDFPGFEIKSGETIQAKRRPSTRRA
ncbi:glucose-1-phosphate adenylyltransferase subunit GlgD [Chloroflexota bacterium]